MPAREEDAADRREGAASAREVRERGRRQQHAGGCVRGQRPRGARAPGEVRAPRAARQGADRAARGEGRDRAEARVERRIERDPAVARGAVREAGGARPPLRGRTACSITGSSPRTTGGEQPSSRSRRASARAEARRRARELTADAMSVTGPKGSAIDIGLDVGIYPNNLGNPGQADPFVRISAGRPYSPPRRRYTAPKI